MVTAEDWAAILAPVERAALDTCERCEGTGETCPYDGPAWMLTSAEQAQRIDCPDCEGTGWVQA